jgi:formate hydrogenlyase subunit 4
LYRLIRKKSIRADKSSLLINYTPYIILSINVIQFSLINLLNAHYISTLSGLILITLIVIIKKRGKLEV